MAAIRQNYWRPLYIYARRKKFRQEDAEDLTQGFFVQLLSQGRFLNADSDKGRLRSLLLRSFQNFMSNEWRAQSAIERGGDQFIELSGGDRVGMGELRFLSRGEWSVGQFCKLPSVDWLVHGAMNEDDGQAVRIVQRMAQE